MFFFFFLIFLAVLSSSLFHKGTRVSYGAVVHVNDCGWRICPEYDIYDSNLLANDQKTFHRVPSQKISVSKPHSRYSYQIYRFITFDGIRVYIIIFINPLKV